MRYFITSGLHHALSITTVDYNNKTLLLHLNRPYSVAEGTGVISRYELIDAAVEHRVPEFVMASTSVYKRTDG